MKEKICCICGKKFTEWGNNPRPVKDEGTCCDDCNMRYVLPARVFGLSAIVVPKGEQK